MSDRQPAVAGMFYPDNPAALRNMVQDFLENADASGPGPKAIIAPHAGYIYSGPIAASAYARLLPVRDRIKRVMLHTKGMNLHLPVLKRLPR